MLEFVRAEQAGDPHGLRFGSQVYLLRSAGGGFASAELTWDEALLAQLAAERLPGCDPALIQSLGERLRRFVSAAGWAGHESGILAAVASQQRVIITFCSAAAVQPNSAPVPVGEPLDEAKFGYFGIGPLRQHFASMHDKLQLVLVSPLTQQRPAVLLLPRLPLLLRLSVAEPAFQAGNVKSANYQKRLKHFRAWQRSWLRGSTWSTSAFGTAVVDSLANLT